jgi:hypothetical protein
MDRLLTQLREYAGVRENKSLMSKGALNLLRLESGLPSTRTRQRTSRKQVAILGTDFATLAALSSCARRS